MKGAGRTRVRGTSSAIAPSWPLRALVGVLVGGLFAVPFVAMAEFTLRDGDGHSLTHWTGLLDPANSGRYAALWLGLENSLVLAAVTVAIVLLLLAPTMLLVTLRFPRLRRPLELVALLPLSIPAVVMVVGLAPVYLVIGRTFGTGIWSLSLAYGVTVLPYAYRAIQASIDATDVRTLAEAARTLGAGWGTVVLRVLAPNLRGGLLAAALVAVAVVLGEFTIASLLARQNLQTALVVVNKQDPYVAIILSLLALFLAFALLVLIGRAGSGTRKEGRGA